jgi:hypothetical protein
MRDAKDVVTRLRVAQEQRAQVAARMRDAQAESRLDVAEDAEVVDWEDGEEEEEEGEAEAEAEAGPDAGADGSGDDSAAFAARG